MNRKSYPISVGWPERLGIRLPICTINLNSNSLVLPLRVNSIIRGRGHVGVKLDAPFDVERVPGSWSKHIPEKKPRYRVSQPDDDWSVDLEPTRLSLAGVNTSILVPLIARRPQTCLILKGEAHGVYHNRDGHTPYTFCGRTAHIVTTNWGEMLYQHYVHDTIPTCPACLEYRSVWCLFSVFAYDATASKRHAKGSTAAGSKEKSVEARRLQLPTVYARILDDDFLENPSYKLAHRKTSPIEQDPLNEEFEDPRDSKRASAIDRNRRLEESKAVVQGHRRR